MHRASETVENRVAETVYLRVAGEARCRQDVARICLALQAVQGRAVVAGFDGGAIASDAGAMLLGAADRAIGVIARVFQLLRGPPARRS